MNKLNANNFIFKKFDFFHYFNFENFWSISNKYGKILFGTLTEKLSVFSKYRNFNYFIWFVVVFINRITIENKLSLEHEINNHISVKCPWGKCYPNILDFYDSLLLKSHLRQILIVWHLNTSDNYTWYQVVRLVFRCVILMCLTNVFKSEKIYNLNETDCERVPSKSEIL